MNNDYEIRGDVTAIFLSRRDGTVLETLIDTCDLHRAKEFNRKWYANLHAKSKTFYVVGGIQKENGKSTLVLLHRWITGAPEGLDVDHFNHDTLDNRRCNLRVIKHSENMQNRVVQRNSKSGVRNVYWHNEKQKWLVQIRVNNQRIHLGYFNEIVEAKKAAEEARAKYMPYSQEAAMQEVVSGSIEAAATSEPLYSLKSFLDAVDTRKGGLTFENLYHWENDRQTSTGANRNIGR